MQKPLLYNHRENVFLKRRGTNGLSRQRKTLNHMWLKSAEEIVFTEPITSETWADANKRFMINV